MKNKNPKITFNTVPIHFEIMRADSSNNDNEFERYRAADDLFQAYLFLQSIGEWSSREMGVGKVQPMCINTYYVLEKNTNVALHRLHCIIKNLNLQEFTQVRIGEVYSSEVDYAKIFKKRKSFTRVISKPLQEVVGVIKNEKGNGKKG